MKGIRPIAGCLYFPGIEQYGARTEAREIGIHPEILKDLVGLHHIREEVVKGGKVPLVPAQLPDRAALGLFPLDLEKGVEGPVCHDTAMSRSRTRSGCRTVWTIFSANSALSLVARFDSVMSVKVSTTPSITLSSVL